jgi:hypothetical protein
MKEVHGRRLEQRRQVHELSRAVIRLHAGVLALVCALLGGVGLFVMTAWLLIQGGPHVGLHLRLLAHYFIGYSVTWKGSVVGLCYGSLVGSLVGWAVGTLYNRIVAFRQR